MRPWPLLLAVLAGGAAHGETFTGRVVGVSDGDTLTVLDAGRERHRVRVSGIDAPERGQNFDRRSRQNLSRLAFQRDARFECRKSERDEGKVCKVWVRPPDCPSCDFTVDAGYAQIMAGLAWWDREHAKEQASGDRARYESAEDEARQRHRGLWGDPKPVPPWEWRRGR